MDLSRTVVVPGPFVRFSQTDFNRHFTVREIVRDSERGMYNLVHRTGLAHLEHHFAVMFFASDLKVRPSTHTHVTIIHRGVIVIVIDRDTHEKKTVSHHHEH